MPTVTSPGRSLPIALPPGPNDGFVVSLRDDVAPLQVPSEQRRMDDSEDLPRRPGPAPLRRDPVPVQAVRDPGEGHAASLPGPDSPHDGRLALVHDEAAVSDIVAEGRGRPVESAREGLLPHPVANPLAADP